MIRILVCETSPEKMEIIHSQLSIFSAPLSQEIQVYWLHGSDSKTYVAEYARQAHLAILSMELKDGLEIAQTIHRQNSLCRLLLHSGTIEQLEAWIPSGPVSFLHNLATISAELSRLAEELMLDENLFIFSAQREKVIVPYQDIMYFQSMLRYLDVFAYGKSLGRFLGKLDDMEKIIPKGLFLRIHQSYLVNSRCVIGLDYTTHELILMQRIRLPISAKYYRQVCDYFSKSGTSSGMC